MADVTIELEGNFGAAIANLTRGLTDLREPFSSFGEHLINRIDEGFEEEVSPYGDRWAPLTDAYLAYKQRKGAILKVLEYNGDMRASTGYQEFTDGLIVGFNDRKAAHHQFGTGRGLPARPMLPDDRQGLPAQDEQELLSIFQEWAQAQWGG